MFNSKLSIHCILWIFGAAFLTSCLHQSSSALTGKWQETRGRAIIEFFENRTFKTVDNMGMTVSGTYSINDKGKVRFEILSQQVVRLRRNQSLSTESSRLPWVLTGRDLTHILSKSTHTLRILHAHRRGRSHQEVDFLGISRFFLDKHPAITYNYFKAT